MSDYTQEIRVSNEILARVVEAYRKIRNTLRYLLGNLYDFDPVADLVPAAKMEEVDRYVLARYADVGRRILLAYQAYDYGTIFQATQHIRDGRPELRSTPTCRKIVCTPSPRDRASGVQPRRPCI